MNKTLALDTLRGRPGPRPAHTEYSLEYHTDYFRQVSGFEPWTIEARRAVYARWSFDFLWFTNDGLHGDWGQRGRHTDMGHAIYAGDASDQREAQTSPFQDPEDVWAFDPVEEYGLPDFQEQVDAYEQLWQQQCRQFPEQLAPGGYYKTLMSGAIEVFGWDMLLLAASNPQKMDRVFDGFFRFTKFHMEAWAQTSAEIIIQHDDFVWASGPFLKPDLYRSMIIPRYAELWKPLKAAGKTILFCSDGLFTEFMPDLLDAGADGLIFEPCNDFTFMVERFGDAATLIGSAVDCRDLTFGPWERVQAAMDLTMRLWPRCRRGLVWAVGNHLPANIPDAMLEQYQAYLQKLWTPST